MSDIDFVRQQAEQDHFRNSQAQMKTEQDIRDAALREAYNAQLDLERRRARGEAV
jgi:hypothetical protein